MKSETNRSGSDAPPTRTGSIPVTVVLPVRNEEKHLACALPRLQEFCEILVVDSGSTDGTGRVATEAGARVLQFVWNGGFPKKRNWALRQVAFRTPWVLFLDADELMTPAFLEELRAVLPTTRHAGFWIEYENHFLGRRLRHGHRMRKLCLFRVGAGEYEAIPEQRWSNLDMEVHEHPVIAGTLGTMHARLDHADQRDFADQIRKHDEYSSWEARRYLALRQPGSAAGAQQTVRQRRKYRHLSRWWLAPAYFLSAYVLRAGFLDGWAGFHYAVFKAFYFWQIRMKIIEAGRRPNHATADASD